MNKAETANNPKYSMYEIGRFTYGEPDICTWGEGATLKIGKFCQIASDAKFLMPGGMHHLNTLTTYPLFWNKIFNAKHYSEMLPKQDFYHKQYSDTIVGNDVWIGYNALIMPGIKLVMVPLLESILS